MMTALMLWRKNAPGENIVVRGARVLDPAVAVMVTESEFAVCQFRVTLWPGLITFALAEKTRPLVPLA